MFLVSLCCFLLLCACSYQKSQNLHFHSSRNFTSYKVVKHVIGETVIPLHPQRIVALDVYAREVAIIFGFKLVGAPKVDIELLGTQAKQYNFTDIGWTPSLEKVLALKPDLILGSVRWFRDTYKQWSQIAPTVMISLEELGEWQRPFVQVANVLGKTDLAKQIVAKYHRRLTEFRTKMGDRLKTTKVSMVLLIPETVSLLTKGVFSGVILEDAGLSRPSSQDFDSKASLRMWGNPVRQAISNELLTEADGDVLFVVANGFPNSADSQKGIQQLMTQPLWSKLKVVQEGKVFVVGKHWLYGSYFSANLVIDDLFQYLVK